jgi:hypothetical protein
LRAPPPCGACQIPYFVRLKSTAYPKIQPQPPTGMLHRGRGTQK